MDGNAAIDIFATKGVEYLAVIGFLGLLILYWRLLNRPVVPMPRAPIPDRRVAGGWFTLRDGYYYHQGHTWAAPDRERIVAVGMDDFAGKLLGPPEGFEFPDPGAQLRQGEPAWKVKVDSNAVRMVSPVDGEVVEVNPEVLRSPDLACEDPYGGGWLLKVRTPRPRAAARNLLSGELARVWLEQTAERLRTMTAGHLGLVLTDGGFPVSGFARALSPDRWDEVAERFLLSDEKGGREEGPEPVPSGRGK